VNAIPGYGAIGAAVGTGVQGMSGDGGAALEARLAFPQAVAVDTQGNLYVADTANSRVRRGNLNGAIETVFPPLAPPMALAVDPSGNLAISYGSQINLWKPGDTSPALPSLAPATGGVTESRRLIRWCLGQPA